MAGLDARGAAARLLLGVTEGRAALSDQMAADWFRALPPAERARAQRLVLAALRNLSRADAVLKPLLRKAPPPEVLAVLRLAAVEMLALGGAAHGVVHDAVRAVRGGGRRTETLAGLTNAVLRRVAETPADAWAALPPPPMAPWLRRRLSEAWGKPAVQAMEAVQALTPPIDLTTKDGDAARLAAAVGGTVLPTGSVRLQPGAQLSDLPGYAEGDWWVQDAAAAMAAKVLAPRPGERILDLCAAPGGKTLQLAAVGARVTALDVSQSRMARVAENLGRCGLSAETVVADALDYDAPPFDAVLLDAPCTATGTLRRHPELPLIRDGQGIAAIAGTQARMIDRAVALTRPGGRIVYCTCSLLPEEGEAQLGAALGRHPGLTVDSDALRLPGIEPGWIGPDGSLRLRPDYWADRGGMDGFFIAALRKAA